ncbi:MAG TPA: ABC transporter permease [Candidatus Cybelea sp.]|nr:ABC transporter permease [Candidatus Cybelea sp.]
MMKGLFQDFRYGWRVLRSAPGFSIAAILTLALGIGANSTIFSWIDSTILNPIPGVKHTNQYTELTMGRHADQQNPMSYPDYKDLRDRNQAFSSLVGSAMWPMSLTASGKPERVWGTLVTANYFDALGVRPIGGRGFLPSEDIRPGGAPVVVISYRLWQTHFGQDRSVLGRTVQIDRHPYQIVGVAPQVFQGTQTGLRSDMWIPVMMVQQAYGGSRDLLQLRDAQWLIVFGRLKPRVTLDEAQADANVIIKQIARAYPDSHQRDFAITVHPLWRAPFGANFYLHEILALLMAIAGVVLLLACANVANLMLVRSIGRRREMAVRLAMGASRGRLVRQLLAESLIVAGLGGGVAMLFTVWSAGTLSDFVPPVAEVPIAMVVTANRTVLLVTLALSLLTGVVFGILPALRASELRPAAVLKEEAGSVAGAIRKARLSSVLVVAQIAMSLLLLVCAGLFIRSFESAQKFNPGFNPHKVLLCSYDLRGLGYTTTSGPTFARELYAKLEAIPGVEAATLADWVPLGFGSSGLEVHPEGYVPQPHESMVVDAASVGPKYFKTMQIPLRGGRDFRPNDDDKGQLVVIVDQEFARRYWPGQDAVGKRVGAEGKRFTVIGVAQNIDSDHLGQKPEPFLYTPLFQDYSQAVSIEVRAAGDPLGFFSAVEQAVRSLDADVPLFDVTTLDSRILLNTMTQRMGGAFVGGFGILAMVLAAVGIYGLLAYVTRQRTHEIGIRMALGADPRDVLELVLRQGLKLAAFGLAIGLLASLVLTRALSSQLFGVTPADPPTYLAVIILLLGVALVACYLPARRAMKVDPMVALRHE